MGGANSIAHAVFHVSRDTPARFGFIVSKAVGNAVTRNLVRRRFKTVADRRLAAGFTGIDVVFRVLPRAATASFDDLEQDTNRALDRIQHLQSQTAAKASA